jgi:hypothetical protein
MPRPGYDLEDYDLLSLDSLNLRQPITGGNTGMWASLGDAGFGNNLMARQRAQMLADTKERQRLMGNVAAEHYASKAGGYVRRT